MGKCYQVMTWEKLFRIQNDLNLNDLNDLMVLATTDIMNYDIGKIHLYLSTGGACESRGNTVGQN